MNHKAAAPAVKDANPIANQRNSSPRFEFFFDMSIERTIRCVAMAGILTGIDNTVDHLLCKTWLQSKTLSPLQPATADDVNDAQAR